MIWIFHSNVQCITRWFWRTAIFKTKLAWKTSKTCSSITKGSQKSDKKTNTVRIIWSELKKKKEKMKASIRHCGAASTGYWSLEPLAKNSINEDMCPTASIYKTTSIHIWTAIVWKKKSWNPHESNQKRNAVRFSL